MCPHKEWFDCLTPCNGGTVLMGNDAVCEVLGRGTIKIKMFDGIVRTLGDVRYIPDLKKNLISLGTLDSIDCSISIKGGVMKVSKAAMVIMKGQKTGNLYKLMGKTVIGGASVSTHASSSNDNSELWHKRLGHLSEGGMLELHKSKLLQGVKSCKLDFCKFCVFGKHKRVSFKAASHTSKEVLEIFGCPAYVHLQNEERSKLDPKSKECIFLGYEEGVKGYRLWDPVAKKMVISRDVVFSEAHMFNTNATSSERQGHTVEIKLHEQRTKSTDESTDGSTDEQSLEDPEEHPSDSWNLVRDREPLLDDGSLLLLTLYVDDMLIAAKRKSHILHLKKLLSREFDMKDLGSAKKILGMEIHRDRKAGKLWVRPTLASCLIVMGQKVRFLALWILIMRGTWILGEYMALTEAVKEELWLKGLVEELGFKQHGVLLQCDSQSALDLAKNQIFHARTKHIDVRYHRVWEWINSKEIVVHKVHTNDNAADMLMKTVTTEKFKHCLSLIHLLSLVEFKVECIPIFKGDARWST
ncbi:hypothetical protein RJ639_038733 [Escallonia herrerae]|uniref:Retrovirus-related Pol polyprotein from transposon TNT 1-94 n=1 Tax=Escallonia herrerae TaxID=1293975 RepID=A0AA88WJX4_9ASTE|nr:hypothetical protein RJ639_038733 [Escallonia herrerae]